ncbi:AAA family ATPase [Streptomyces sp. BE230]|uniref:AAA family ATPase n=1 Tax=Streptomyces sp. BE230 TaxID=3002526 RepID=UPI002ED53DD4|nr:AAA family ATPase [Streptomyces sp. BE230]
MTFTFTDATRETAKARIALQGPAGCGKTKTALRLAEGLAKNGVIALADTERGSAKKYAPVPGRPDLGGHRFKHVEMNTHDPRHLIEVVRQAEEIGVEVLIVDSYSHFWNGKGGLLEIVETAGAKAGSGGTFGGWRTGNPIEQDMLDALLNFRGHVIVTMRTKGDYVIEGKKVTKVGVKAVQREGAEYEFDVVMDMVEGTATVTKTRYTPLDGLSIHHPGEEIGETILDQLGQGIDPVAAITDAAASDGLTLDAVLQLSADAARRNLRQAGVLHPASGEPTTLDALLRERLGDVVTVLLDDNSMTYDRAIELHQRASSGGWLGVERPAEADGKTVTLGDLIKARGTALKPTPQKAPASTPSTGNATVQQGQDQGQQSAATGLVSAPQMRMMHACFAKVGLGAKEQREDRLRATSLIVDRQVGSANELTFDEAATLLDTLSAFGDRANPADEFAAMVQGLEDALVNA